MNTKTDITKNQRNDLLRAIHHKDDSFCSELDIAANIVEEMLCRFPAPECWEQQEAVNQANEFLHRIRGDSSARFKTYINQ